MSATNRWWRDRDAECALWLAARGETDRRWWERVNDDEIGDIVRHALSFLARSTSP